MIGNFPASPPVIVMGMHRSGTRALAALLVRVGVSLGNDRNAHGESRFFLELNQAVFDAAGAAWDQPELLRPFLSKPADRAARSAALRSALASFSATGRWGWKDPRNILTLPLWLEIFPEARVLHLVRNGVDVALSLRRREERRKDKPRRKSFSSRCLSLDGGFALWTGYVEAGLQGLAALPAGRGLQIRFEDLVRQPRETAASLLRFLELNPRAGELEAGLKELKPEMAYAFRNDPEGASFYETHKDHPLMKRLGYDR